MSSSEENGAVRLDKWLHAARWFKTRSLAAEAVDGGKVHLNENRVKRSRTVTVGDRLRIRKGPYEYRVTVTGLSERRVSAEAARGLYQEHEESIRARSLIAETLKSAPDPTFRGGGRPTKKNRRELMKIKRRP